MLGTLTGPGVMIWARINSQQTSEMLMYLPPQRWDYRSMQSHPTFYLGFGGSLLSHCEPVPRLLHLVRCKYLLMLFHAHTASCCWSGNALHCGETENQGH